MKQDEGTMRERKCIVTGEVLPEEKLVRFVVDPQGRATPDVAAKLPGRGIWVSATREAIERAVAKNLFAKAAKANVTAPKDLADIVERQLVLRMQGDLGLARRSASLVMGFDNVMRALDAKMPPKLLIEASDGAPDGRRKLSNAALARGGHPATLDCLTSHELSVALGRENVIHAALLPGGFAERLAFDAARLEGIRHAKNTKEGAGPIPAPDERDA
ncbi:MAG: RNA-binding protein [Proteobacteria bacterium]|nr:RNA-binding protein [Pseudomonadota bacterium]